MMAAGPSVDLGLTFVPFVSSNVFTEIPLAMYTKIVLGPKRRVHACMS